MDYVDSEGIFSKVVLNSLHRNVPKDINLYKPVKNKVYFHELKVRKHQKYVLVSSCIIMCVDCRHI